MPAVDAALNRVGVRAVRASRQDVRVRASQARLRSVIMCTAEDNLAAVGVAAI